MKLVVEFFPILLNPHHHHDHHPLPKETRLDPITMPVYHRDVKKYYREFWYSGNGEAGPFIDDHDCRKSFKDEFLEMKARFQTQNKSLPITLPDCLSRLFSDDAKPRDRMVRFWCSLEIDSKRKNASTHTTVIIPSSPWEDGSVFDVESDYPSIFTKKNGPVPIQIAQGRDAYERIGKADASRGTGDDYKWKDEHYRNAILALRANDARPLCHLRPRNPHNHQHLKSRGGPGKTCGELLPSVVFGSGGNDWDDNEFGCGGCDAHALIFTYIALGEQSLENLNESVSFYIDLLNNRRYKYEDFWRLLAQQRVQNYRGEEKANAWGMAKLRCLDEDRERRYYWNEKKVQQIRNQMALSMEKRRTRLANQKTNGKKGIPARRVVKPKAPARIEIVESDSDDDMVKRWDLLESQNSTASTSASGSPTRAQKRQIVHVDSDSDESEDDAFKKFKKTMEGFRK